MSKLSNNVVKEQKFGFWRTQFFGIGNLGYNNILMCSSMFFMFYCTDVMLIPAAAVNVMYLVMRLFDAANDIGIGALADRTKSRWGSYRPWIIFGAIPYAIAVGVMFSSNPDWSMGGKIAFMYFGYMIYTLGCTCVGVPMSALPQVVTTDNTIRGKLLSAGSAWQAFGSMIVGLFGSKLVAHFIGKTGAMHTGYTTTVWIICAAFVIFNFFPVFASKEILKPSYPTKEEKAAQKASREKGFWRKVLLSKNFLAAMILSTGYGFLAAGRGMVGVYYFLTVGGGYALMGIYNAVMYGFCFLGGQLFVWILRKLFKGNIKTMMFIWVLLYAAVMAMQYFVHPVASQGLFLVTGALTGFFLGSVGAGTFVMAAQCIEEAYLKAGTRASSLMMGVKSFTNKLGTAICPFLITGAQAIYGYVAGAATQSATAVHGMNVVFTLAPAIIMAVFGLIVLLYDITPKKMGEIEAGIKKMEAEKAATTEA